MHVILVEPSEPGNVGAAARALKTMGLARLTLVRPQCDIADETAYWMAYGAQDVLQSARTVDRLHDAIAGCRFVAGMTSRPRHPSRQPHVSLMQFVTAARACSDDTAFVFGSERAGLPNDDLALCTHVVTIPHAVDYPSLNLSHAVMVACYEWLRHDAAAPQPAEPPARMEELERFLDEMGDADREFVRAMRGMLCARGITARDLRLLYQLIH
jgi:tRNA (cytidine32/uridine32-2'-O)-methyltransferase